MTITQLFSSAVLYTNKLYTAGRS